MSRKQEIFPHFFPTQTYEMSTIIHSSYNWEIIFQNCFIKYLLGIQQLKMDRQNKTTQHDKA